MPYQHLSAHERYVIFMLSQYGLGQAEIARRLGRSPSTISRERRCGQNELGRYIDRLAEARDDPSAPCPASSTGRSPQVGGLCPGQTPSVLATAGHRRATADRLSRSGRDADQPGTGVSMDIR